MRDESNKVTAVSTSSWLSPKWHLTLLNKMYHQYINRIHLHQYHQYIKFKVGLSAGTNLAQLIKLCVWLQFSETYFWLSHKTHQSQHRMQCTYCQIITAYNKILKHSMQKITKSNQKTSNLHWEMCSHQANTRDRYTVCPQKNIPNIFVHNLKTNY